MSESNSREIVVPGDLLSDSPELKAGVGTFREKGRIYAAQIGIKSIRGNYVNVVPLAGKYIPKAGDMVIGVIVDIGPSNWLVDINCPYPAPLHVNDVPWRVDFGDTARYLNIGNSILVKVLKVDETKRIQLTLKEQGLRKLTSGRIIEIPHSKVPRVIGKGGSMISMLKNYTNTRMFVGQNGRIWIDGEPDDIRLAVEAITMIDREAHLLGLTEKVKEFLESKKKIES